MKLDRTSGTRRIAQHRVVDPGLRLTGSRSAPKKSIWDPDPDTVCPRSLDPNYTVTYTIKWVKTSWT